MTNESENVHNTTLPIYTIEKVSIDEENEARDFLKATFFKV